MTYKVKRTALRNNRIAVTFEDKGTYAATIDAEGTIYAVNSCMHAGQFRSYNEDRCPALYAAMQSAYDNFQP